jgi:multiple sugar transport system substrate-binding protein
MKKLKNSVGFAFLLTAASCLSACGNSGAVSFWSPFGASYKNQLDAICAKVSKKTGVEIEHETKGSYPDIRRQMIAAINGGDYPSLAIGYPDHLVNYLEHNVLEPLDGYLSAKERADYKAEYLKEDIFYDNSGEGKQRLYGVPFNKSTEVLGYNGVFVDYCASVQGTGDYSAYSDLENVPTTWNEWAVKGPQYKKIFDDICGKAVYGKQRADGSAYDFSLSEGEGLTKLIDCTNVSNTENYLMCYDADDNAFITLLRQFGGQYTELPDSEAKKPAGRRVGKVKFTNSTNLPKVVNMFKFFRDLNRKKVFATPGYLDDSYASGPFENYKVMFMICSSGGLSHTTTKANYNFSVKPVPYYVDESVSPAVSRKFVISQGANICMTNSGDAKKAAKVLKALTTGDIQAEWCLQTGYFPGSTSAEKSSAYQKFLNSTDTSNKLMKVYREAAKINSGTYTKSTEKWNNFVDPAFVGSAILREKLQGILKYAFDLKGDVMPSDQEFKNIVLALEDISDLKLNTIKFEH